MTKMTAKRNTVPSIDATAMKSPAPISPAVLDTGESPPATSFNSLQAKETNNSTEATKVPPFAPTNEPVALVAGGEQPEASGGIHG